MAAIITKTGIQNSPAREQSAISEAPLITADFRCITTRSKRKSFIFTNSSLWRGKTRCFINQ